MIIRGIPHFSRTMKKIVAFGNPLLDTTIFVDDNFLLDKYNLEKDGQKEISNDEMKRLTEDISGYRHYKNAGGCAQNSLRVLQWLLKKQCEAVIIGSTGKDTTATDLKVLLENDGVKTRYIVQENLPTGKTVALVNGINRSNRSLVAYIGAAEKFPVNDLLAMHDFENLVKASDFVYIEGFFLTNRTETAKYVLDFCNKHNKVIIFNICGEYVCDILPDTVKYFAENSDIVFGNRREFEALRKIMKHDSIKSLTDILITNGRGKMKYYGNIIVITDGPKMGTCVYGSNQTEKFHVLQIDKNDIKDTTGAGDAFVGGFIAGLCRGKSVKECAEIGCYSAHHLIKQTGCSLPNFIPDIFE